MREQRIIGLILLCMPLSVLSFGGGQTIIADLQHQTVAVHGWLTDRQFTDLFAVSRVAPGPSTLIVALIGWQVAGLAGALAATAAIFIPSSLVVYAAGRLWQRHRGAPWIVAIERGLAPVAVGLIFAGALAVAQSAHIDLIGLATVAVVGAILYSTKIGPYPVLAAVAGFYLVLHLLVG
jgi:chromate transporter